jgi:hypothetical protein
MKQKLIVHLNEDGEIDLYANAALTALLKDVDIYVVEGDGYGDLVATDTDVEEWAEVPAKVKKAVKDAGEAI